MNQPRSSTPPPQQPPAFAEASAVDISYCSSVYVVQKLWHDDPDDLNRVLSRNLGKIDHEGIPGTYVRVFTNRRGVSSVRCHGHESAIGPALESALWKVGRNGDVPLAVFLNAQGRVSEQSSRAWSHAWLNAVDVNGSIVSRHVSRGGVVGWGEHRHITKGHEGGQEDFFSALWSCDWSAYQINEAQYSY